MSAGSRVSAKKRGTCDECRSRKVKCSGTSPCDNCHSDYVACVYSSRKPVGRPRKRPRVNPTSDNDLASQTPSASAVTPAHTDVSFTLGDVYPQQPFAHSLDFSMIETPVMSDAINTPVTPDAMPGTCTPPCPCLSMAYLTTTQLQYPSTSSDLPSAMADLKAALASANSILKCTQCPKQMTTAMQNLFQVGSLLLTFVGRMQTLLAQVDDGVDVDTNALQDPAIVMSDHQFRLFFRKTLKETVLGSKSDRSDATLHGIMLRFEERQQEWHADPQMYGKQAKLFGKRVATNFTHECQSRVCERLIELINASISSLEL